MCSLFFIWLWFNFFECNAVFIIFFILSLFLPQMQNSFVLHFVFPLGVWIGLVSYFLSRQTSEDDTVWVWLYVCFSGSADFSCISISVSLVVRIVFNKFSCANSVFVFLDLSVSLSPVSLVSKNFVSPYCLRCSNIQAFTNSSFFWQLMHVNSRAGQLLLGF